MQFLFLCVLVNKTHQIPAEIPLDDFHQLTRQLLPYVRHKVRTCALGRGICIDNLFLDFGDLFVVVLEPSIVREIVNVNPVVAV
jgi:hypothetical protein